MLPEEVLFQYLKPIYPMLSTLLVTGGDPFTSPYSEKYFDYIFENFPAVNVFTESNGLAFSQKYLDEFVSNLALCHFSLNASNAEVFHKGCWLANNANDIYERILSNIEAYTSRLRENHMEAFFPNYSMVINEDTYGDVVDFLKLTLRLGARGTSFFFDYTENNASGDLLANPEHTREALYTLLELQTLLKDHYYLSFDLFTPIKEIDSAKNNYETDIDVLKEKYHDIYELVKERSIIQEWKERNRIRKNFGKKELTLVQDMATTTREENICGKVRCFAPWKALDVYPNGDISYCGWVNGKNSIYDYVESGELEKEKLFNSLLFQIARFDVGSGRYTECLRSCPLNVRYNSGHYPLEACLSEENYHYLYQ